MTEAPPAPVPAPAPSIPDGIDPNRWYDSDQFCAILRIAEKRRLALAKSLRDSKDATPNGHSFIAQGMVMITLLRNLST